MRLGQSSPCRPPRQRVGPSGSRSRRTRFLFGILAAAALLVLSPALGPATASPPGTSSGPPYRGVQSTIGMSEWQAGCGNVSHLVRPHFESSVGVLGLGGTGTSSSCNTSGTNFAFVNNWYIESFIPVALAAGEHGVTVNGSLAAYASDSLSRGPCHFLSTNYSFCQQYAVANLTVQVYLYDPATGAIFTARAPWWLNSETWSETDCRSGTCSSYNITGPHVARISTTFSLTFHPPRFNPKHAFGILLVAAGYLNVGDQAWNATIGPGHARATLNFGWAGHGLTVASIRVH
jgi:hypothetical protein